MKWPLLICIFFCGCNAIENKPAPVKAGPHTDTNLIKQQTANPFAPVDLSAMDISYFPADYPVRKMTAPGMAPPVARVIYSRPHRQGRKIFGNLLPYGQPWRLGANEATEIEFFKPVFIQNKKVAKGRYIIYCIPQPKRWTVALNTNLYTWGLKIDATKDVYRFEIPVENTAGTIEYFTMAFQPAAAGANLVIAWDEVVARLPITLP